jgi:hypothetical protein
MRVSLLNSFQLSIKHSRIDSESTHSTLTMETLPKLDKHHSTKQEFEVFSFQAGTRMLDDKCLLSPRPVCPL